MKTPPGSPTCHPFAGCLYFTANAVARQVTKLAEEAFRPTGLCPSGALLLCLVVERPGIAPGQAAEILHLAPSSVTRFADALDQRGLLVREASGRQMLLHPTAAGRQALLKVKHAWDELYRTYSERVGRETGDALAGELARVAEALSASR